MSFTLHNRARTWFGIQDQRGFARTMDPATKESTPRFLMFDAFYSCLLLGLDGERHGRAEDLETDEFAKVYPEAYRGQAELIAGLLVDAELRLREARHIEDAVQAAVSAAVDGVHCTVLARAS